MALYFGDAQVVIDGEMVTPLRLTITGNPEGGWGGSVGGPPGQSDPPGPNHLRRHSQGPRLRTDQTRRPMRLLQLAPRPAVQLRRGAAGLRRRVRAVRLRGAECGPRGLGVEVRFYGELDPSEQEAARRSRIPFSWHDIAQIIAWRARLGLDQPPPEPTPPRPRLIGRQFGVAGHRKQPKLEPPRPDPARSSRRAGPHGERPASLTRYLVSPGPVRGTRLHFRIQRAGCERAPRRRITAMVLASRSSIA